MGRELINTRVELDRETDFDLKRIAKTESRSKRQMLALLAGRVVRQWKKDPDQLRALGLIRD